MAGVTSFGYPGSYTGPDGTFVGGLGVEALAAFLGNPAAVGAAEVALAPTSFPAPWNNRIFIGFHGNFVTAGGGNLQNPVLYYNFDTNTIIVFIAAGRTGVGHLDGLWSTATALYLADFSSGDGFAAGTGVIYKIEAAPEPGSLLLGLGGLGLLALLRQRSRGRRA